MTLRLLQDPLQQPGNVDQLVRHTSSSDRACWSGCIVDQTKLIDPMRRRQGDSAAFYKRYARGDPHGEDEARKSTGRQTAHSACLRLRLYARGTMAALAHALAAWRGLLHHQDASATQAHAQRDTSTNRDASTGSIRG